MAKELLLAIDVGTQSTRALIFDLQGNLLFKTKIPLPVYNAPKPGWAELDPQRFWESLCQACQRLWATPGVEKDQIAGVAITTQRNVLINLDRQGSPLRPAIHWSDQRRTSGLPNVGGVWGLLFALSGMMGTIRYLQAEAKTNWVRTYQPEIWNKTAKIMLLSGYLTYRMTGQYRDSTACQVAHLPFDYKKHAWAGKLDWKWKAVPMEPEMLVDLVPPTALLGEVTPRASEETGIPAGLPLIAAAADKACEVLGSGTLASNTCCLSYGTAATINTIHQRYIEVIPLIPPYPAAVPGSYSLEIQLFRGYWMVSWFLREFGHNEQRLAKERGVAPEELFDDLVNSVPAGSMGLTLQPYWAPGLKSPGPDAKGAMIGFGGVHTRAHIYRAMLEGLAYALREGAERTSKRSGVPITEVRVAGGGSQSDAAAQLTADIFGMPVSRPHVYEASGLGAAIDLAVGLKLKASFESAVADMTRISRTFEPNLENHKLYDDLYRRVYLKMYDRLAPLYKEIQDITGYPAKD
ncbi:MAG TPA: FGGY-family carbohydrate kinase [Anaerolineaceae bacterium]|jgi:sugar (pentulose or hexulose) kinase|nr:FGGY-family carbohydrate kinase [Chloroflexota bacterium]HNZ15951.1 FGGY-family carbohydrate kinase [Anaerolineaceae bacterium]